MKKNQHLVIGLIAHQSTLQTEQHLLEKLLANDCLIESSHWQQLDTLHSYTASIIGSWEQIAKLELQLKKQCHGKAIELILKRSPTADNPTKADQHAYLVEAMSTAETDISHELIDFFMANQASIISLDNQLLYNRHGMPIRSLTLRTGVPHDTHLAALHEAINDLFDEHNVDGTFALDKSV